MRRPGPAAAPGRRHQCFPRAHRLLTRADFDRVLSRRHRVGDRYFLIVVRRRPAGESHARLGLAIGRKCARRAVDRNRLKRLVRESFRQCCWTDYPLDIVVLCRPEARLADNAALHAALSHCWSELKARARGDADRLAGPAT